MLTLTNKNLLNVLITVPKSADKREDNSFPFSSSSPFWFLDKPPAVEEIQIEKVFLKMLYRESPPQSVIKDQVKRQIFSELGKKSGGVRKPDALQRLIIKIVAKNPKIKQRELEWALNREKGDGIILSVNENIIEFENSKNKDGESDIREIKINNLKDRLYRAKEFIAETGIARER